MGDILKIVQQLRPSWRASGLRQILCLAVVCALVLVAFHCHSAIDTTDAQPISGSHHCLVCITAHLPQVVSTTVAFAPPLTARAGTLTTALNGRMHDVLLPFSLYMRPPPA